MKVCGILIFVAAVAGYASAGPARIPNHPICVAIMNSFYHSFPDADDCKCFYKCDWADAVRFCCPKDNETPNEDGYLVFNPTLQVCDRKPAAEAAGAVCTGSPGVTDPPGPTPPPACTTSTASPPSSPNPPGADGCAHRQSECPPDNAFYHSFIHETCDNKWCQCDWGKTVLQPCPATLIFNDVLQVCDWPVAGSNPNMC